MRSKSCPIVEMVHYGSNCVMFSENSDGNAQKIWWKSNRLFPILNFIRNFNYSKIAHFISRYLRATLYELLKYFSVTYHKLCISDSQSSKSWLATQRKDRKIMSNCKLVANLQLHITHEMAKMVNSAIEQVRQSQKSIFPLLFSFRLHISANENHKYFFVRNFKTKKIQLVFLIVRSIGHFNLICLFMLFCSTTVCINAFLWRWHNEKINTFQIPVQDTTFQFEHRSEVVHWPRFHITFPHRKPLSSIPRIDPILKTREI